MESSFEEFIETFIGKELPISMVEPNKTLVEIFVEVEDRPGVIEKLSSVLRRNRINILVIHGFVKDGKGYILTFADISHSNIDYENLKKAIEREVTNSKVKVWKSKVEGLVYDVLTYPPMISGEPVVILKYSTIANILDNILVRFKDAGLILLYYLGLDSGISYANWILNLLRPFGIEGLKEKFIIGLSIVRSLGLLLAIVEFVNDKNVKVIVPSSIETEIAKFVKYSKGCNFIKGFLEGYAKTMFNREINVKEVKCKKRGEKHCEFHIEVKG
mgnify:CR=1 FL=1